MYTRRWQGQGSSSEIQPVKTNTSASKRCFQQGKTKVRPRWARLIKAIARVCHPGHEVMCSNTRARGCSSANPEGNQSVWNIIWRSNVPLRMKHTAWRAATGALVTTTCMQYRHLTQRGTCLLCGITNEDSYHARSVWEGMRRVWSLPTIISLLIVGRNGCLIYCLTAMR